MIIPPKGGTTNEPLPAAVTRKKSQNEPGRISDFVLASRFRASHFEFSASPLWHNCTRPFRCRAATSSASAYCAIQAPWAKDHRAGRNHPAGQRALVVGRRPAARPGCKKSRPARKSRRRRLRSRSLARPSTLAKLSDPQISAILARFAARDSRESAQATPAEGEVAPRPR